MGKELIYGIASLALAFTAAAILCANLWRNRRLKRVFESTTPEGEMPPEPWSIPPPQATAQPRPPPDNRPTIALDRPPGADPEATTHGVPALELREVLLTDGRSEEEQERGVQLELPRLNPPPESPRRTMFLPSGVNLPHPVDPGDDDSDPSLD